ncbi:MAG: lipopolysaccharide biosynthesis protein, partial [bacterium]
MRRVKNVVRAVSSSYLAIAANIVFTAMSVPLALQYLSRAEFGLWAVATQIAGYAGIIDFGMAIAFARALIDHKDNKETGQFGATITTGGVVFVVQGLLVLLIGWLCSPLLPGLMAIPAGLSRNFQILVVGQCGITAFVFATRVLGSPLYAYQRQDVYNYMTALMFLIGLGFQWLGFAWGWGVFSLLFSNGIGAVLTACIGFTVTCRMSLWPKRGQWGRPNFKSFWEMCGFGKDVFLLTVGNQLLNASQVVIVSRIMGLDAAAIWSVCNKAMMVGQQLVSRVFDFSEVALSEMYVRHEHKRLVDRLKDIVMITASMSVFAAVSLAVCNGSFVTVWTSGKVGWGPLNDWLLGAMLMVFTTTRCHTHFVIVTKHTGRMKYIYFMEGVVFVITAALLVSGWGFAGLFVAAIGCDILFSGIYGMHRTAQFARLGSWEVWTWLYPPLKF